MSHTSSAYRLTITGRVQGVFFRHSAKQLADSLGLNGCAKNQADGSVLIEVSGRPEAVQQFIVWCHHGPESAQVESVEVHEIDVLVNSDNFIIS